MEIQVKLDTSKIKKPRRIELYMSKTLSKETIASGTTSNTELSQALHVIWPEDIKSKNVKIYLEADIVSTNLTYEVYASAPWQSDPTTGQTLYSNSTGSTSERQNSGFIDITKLLAESHFLDIKIRGYNTDSTAQSILGKGSQLNIWIDYGEY